MKETYVSFEVAKLLKENGFCERCFMCYEQGGEVFEGFGNWNKTDIYIAAPTHQMACAWIRDKYELHIFADYIIKFKVWHRYVRELKTGIQWSIGGFSSPEEAIEEGIKFTHENLI